MQSTPLNCLDAIHSLVLQCIVLKCNALNCFPLWCSLHNFCNLFSVVLLVLSGLVWQQCNASVLKYPLLHNALNVRCSTCSARLKIYQALALYLYFVYFLYLYFCVCIFIFVRSTKCTGLLQLPAAAASPTLLSHHCKQPSPSLLLWIWNFVLLQAAPLLLWIFYFCCLFLFGASHHLHSFNHLQSSLEIRKSFKANSFDQNYCIWMAPNILAIK